MQGGKGSKAGEILSWGLWGPGGCRTGGSPEGSGGWRTDRSLEGSGGWQGFCRSWGLQGSHGSWGVEGLMELLTDLGAAALMRLLRIPKAAELAGSHRS